MKLFNTLTRQKKEFNPINKNKVNLFVCGPTVYDKSHLGHAKLYTQMDFLVRYMRFIGYDVFYLQNITDIDDKILAKAKEEKTSWNKITEKYEKMYMKDMQKLNNTSVSKYARATDFIEQIVKQVKILIDKGFAYTIDDGIYFEISKFSDYGKLSGRIEIGKEDAVSRIDQNTQKKGWNDFCLWKFSKPDEPSWKTELGNGRPGWHIEDTAITESFFGPQYDVHGGGVDLIIPHHEAEIAQIEAAYAKKPLVRYWVHTAFLTVDGRKMSKSLGNYYTIDDVLKRGYDPLSLRYLFLGGHYRDAINFTWDSLTAAQNGLNRLRLRVKELKSQKSRTTLSEEKNIKISQYQDRFREVMDDDSNTPQALAILWEVLKSNIPSEDKYDLAISFDEVFGLKLNENPKTELLIPGNIHDLVTKREEMRKEGKWDDADKVRKEIEKLGFQVKDTSKGTVIDKN